ncbi:Fe(3+) ABC transporter substrate-binding protein [Methyloligella solikamskensis]|uniref:Fe(3+) ABC transporter substrate-binding protein n=1 Tax=Methyloligella solikamskensis TaxID=1177756 RepID=A0ABW3JCW7_9HYPH
MKRASMRAANRCGGLRAATRTCLAATIAVALAATTLAFTAPAAFAAPEDGGEVNVYSYRQPELIEPLFARFTEKTGIDVNVVFSGKGLIERIKQLGPAAQADLLLTVDIGNLSRAVEEGIAEPVTTETLEAAVPSEYRAEDGSWWGLTRRARVVYASKERVDQDSITYEELADPKWEGRICIRSGQHVYNVALVASMIAHHGEEKTKEWLEGVKANLARKPAGNDRLQVKGVYAGECDIAIGNTYYMGVMLTNDEEPEQKEWANSVDILFPNSGARGTHVNLSGAVVVKDAPHKENAIKLLEFLASEEGQEVYAEMNHEYPVREGVAWSQLVESWGDFEADELPLQEIAKYRERASELIDEVNFDEGPSS